MLTAETKRHIDAARDVLVGKIPDPKSQVHEITNALIYKFMDDMDDRAVTMGGKRRFFTDEYEKYSWRKIMDPRIGAQERIGLYTEALARLSKNPNLPELFRGIFRNAYLPFNDGRTLTLFLAEIDFFDYRHQEELGDAYEYLLSIMGSQGDAGQFRTPRHIIDFIVKVVDPTKDDTVLDPACGTAGFLISAYKHVLSKHDGKDDPARSEKPLSADEKRKLHESYRGFDIDDNMVKMAQVNLYLHGFPNPNVLVHDTLSSEDYWQDRYSVIMANPPFMTPKGGIVPHNKFGVQSNRAEVLFVDYIMSHLKPNGRAGVIVPEGIIFQSTTAHKQLRKNLINDGLYAVVSLPSGVFNPYAGVKTSILFFDNDRAKQQSEILFIKIATEGYDLGAQRRPLCSDNNGKPEWCPKHSDFSEALEALKNWREAVKTESLLALYVPKEKIIESGDYNLSGERYKPSIERTSSWSVVKLGELCDITTGRKDVNQGNPSGKYPFFTCAKEHTYIDTYSFDTEALLIAGNGDVGAVKYYKGKFDAYQRTYVLSSFRSVIAPYLYYILSSTLKDKLQLQKLGNTMPFIKIGMLQDFDIPLPPLEIQQQIVAELDGYQNIITGAQLVVENWKPYIDIDPGWKKVKLGDVCEIGSSKRVFESEWKERGVPFYRAREIVKLAKDGHVNNELFITEQMYREYSNKYGAPKEGDLMVTGVGTLGICYQVKVNDRFYFKDGNIIWFKNFQQNVISTFIKYLFQSDIVKNQIKAGAVGGTVGTYTITNANNTIIPLPSVEIQQQLIIKIEGEQKIVDANKKLIAIYEQKMKDVIAKLWNE